MDYAIKFIHFTLIEVKYRNNTFIASYHAGSTPIIRTSKSWKHIL
jgi:hypothetical protein